MKKKVGLSLMLLSSSVFAIPTIFEMELGKMTEKELKSIYNVKHAGTNKYNNGNMYSIPVSSFNVEGLKEVTTVFNTDGKLVAVLSTLPQSKFDELNKSLSESYKLFIEKIPFMGNKKVVYRDGEREISLEAPFMSFEMSMNYINDDFMRLLNQQGRASKTKVTLPDGSTDVVECPAGSSFYRKGEYDYGCR
ncbi:hypothetical protein [Veronia nyctiphanis]|uniref:hypothetical protein n=1 Tax=Veronia nyctiphanis TaxID=1278244 RepID=UPI00191BD57D|nr:hypothetical protein [Veronia nyctiphanis]